MREHIAYPFRLDGRGRTARAGEDDHVSQLIYQVLFTNPGERVNRPDFGCGLRQLLFAPNSSALATATQFVVRGALERWLAEYIEVQHVRITSVEETLTVEVGYVRRDTGDRRQEIFKAD